MRELLERLHRARLVAGSLDAEVARAREAFEQEHADLFKRRQAAQLEATVATVAVRTAGIAAFKETGDLAPAPGIKIRMVKKLDYDDGEAFDWAREHAAIYLSLRVREFESLARSQPALVPFVAITEEPQATIATDLGPILDGMREADVPPA